MIVCIWWKSEWELGRAGMRMKPFLLADGTFCGRHARVSEGQYRVVIN